MRSIAIIADSTCDLSKELLERYRIKTFPLHIHLGEEEYLDGVNISPEELYQWSDANRATPKTSTVSPGEAQEARDRGFTLTGLGRRILRTETASSFVLAALCLQYEL